MYCIGPSFEEDSFRLCTIRFSNLVDISFSSFGYDETTVLMWSFGEEDAQFGRTAVG